MISGHVNYPYSSISYLQYYSLLLESINTKFNEVYITRKRKAASPRRVQMAYVQSEQVTSISSPSNSPTGEKPELPHLGKSAKTTEFSESGFLRLYVESL